MPDDIPLKRPGKGSANWQLTVSRRGGFFKLSDQAPALNRLNEGKHLGFSRFVGFE